MPDMMHCSLSRRQSNKDTEFINWDGIAAWTHNVEYTSPDFKDVLQEVADLGAITHLVILWDDFEQRSDQVNSHYRNSHSYDDTPSKAPQLVVTYAAPALWDFATWA